MKSWHSVIKSKWQIVTRFAFALLLLGWCGCAHLATVKTKRARIPASSSVEEQLTPAIKFLVAGEHEQPVDALANDLLAARLSYETLSQRPSDDQARKIYNFAVARAVEKLER